jgi:glycopeptide antibiotics resistance protein
VKSYARAVRIRPSFERASRRSTTVALLAAVALILLLTLWPHDSPNRLRLRPLSDITFVGVVGNLLLFLPFGAALCLRRLKLAAAVAVGFAFSVSIELTQLAVHGRTTSVDDVVLNTIGTAAGWATVALLRARAQ